MVGVRISSAAGSVPRQAARERHGIEGSGVGLTVPQVIDIEEISDPW